jgi:hypothetical protein
MPACGQCGRENPEGTAFCGFCGYPLAKPAGKSSSSQLKPGVNPVSLPSVKPPPPPPAPPPKMLRKPEVRMQTFATPPPSDEGKARGGFEWIPWSELSPGQRAGRSVALVVAVLVILFLLRGMLRGVVGGGGTAATAPSAQSASALSEADRKDGIESLCKVFQIYGLPKNDKDASEAASNAAELYKLSGNQSPERSAYILNAVVAEFRAGKLAQPDCAEAGYPLPVTEAAPDDNSAPDAGKGNGQQ